MVGTKIRILMVGILGMAFLSVANPEPKPLDARAVFLSFTDSFYDCIKSEKISYKALQYGLKGYHYLRKSSKLKKKKHLTIVDFSLPSSEERMFVIDLELNKVIHKSLVAHGTETGELDAQTFSNEHDSHMSSLGFYITGRVYRGRHEESIKLHGLEKGFNDNAYDRGVVIHRAEYANRSFLDTNQNVLGRSFGCPAVPFQDYNKLLSLVRDGSCLFIYYPDKDYLRKSRMVNSDKGYENFLEVYNN
ncbi:MAG: murein L,D-transpeptidase catalytic domain family protein [Flavobacteriales bacterium]|nr:murein L,D-transpeptidase catalytic domain family protein [Flavobacteriales bacterium]